MSTKGRCFLGTAEGIALNWSVFSTRATGAARRAYELHRRMSGDLDFVAFVTGEFSHEWRNEFEGFRFVEIGSSRSFIHRLKEGSGSLWKQRLKEHECGLWVTDTLPVPSDLGGARTCITIHDLRYLASRKYVSLKRYLLMRIFMGRSLKRADSIVAVSSWTGQVIHDRFGISPGKVSVIPNAVDGDFASVDMDHGRPFDRPYIFSVGHLEERKNFETLVEAFAGIRDEWEGYLVIVGGDHGSMSSILSRARDLGVSDRLIIKSDVGYSDLAMLYGNSECVVCPSKYEGFGITLLEALSAGRPLIASDIPPHREVAGDAALYFDPGDPEGLAGALLKLLKDDSAVEMLVRSGRSRLDSFSWQESARKLETLYGSLLGR